MALTRIEKTLLNVFLSVAAHAGLQIARITPVRHAAVEAIDRWIAEDARRACMRGEYPARVNQDRSRMAMALVHSIERGLVNGYLSPEVVHRLIENLVRGILVEQGDREAANQFRARFGVFPPSFLVISPGKACNLHCAGCYADAGKASEKLEWPVFDRIISEAKRLWGARFFVISGGEPMAYRSQGKTLLDMVEKHKDCFFLMYTNGTLIDERMARRLAEIANLTPAISVEGLRSSTEARRGEGVYDRILEAMGHLRRAGVPFGISLTATRQNVEEILSDEVIDFYFEKQGALYGWIFHYMPIGRSFTLDLMPTPQQRLWMWRRSWELIRERDIFLADFWNHGTASYGCISAGQYKGGGYFYVDWNGAVTPCVFLPFSPVNIHDVYARGQDLNDIWREPFFASIRRWQDNYQRGNGRRGNWLAPCIIRDHYADLRPMLAQYEPDPIDANARMALQDAAYGEGLAAYGAAYEAISGKIWREDYLGEDTDR
jgi:MoaA/NifB/PqqE/SkfB family radical SAM enzyme